MSNDQQNGRRNFLKNVAIGSTGLLATQMLNIETVQAAVEWLFSPKKHGTNNIL